MADASIYSMIRPVAPAPDPIQQYGQVMSIKGLMGQQQLQDLQRQQVERAMAEEDAVKQFYGSLQPGDDPRTKVGDLMRVSPKAGMAAQKFYQERDKSDADLQKIRIETHLKAAEGLRDVIATLTPENYNPTMLREQAARLFGPDIAAQMKVPETFDPAWQQQQVMTAKELITNLEKAKDRTVTMRGQDMTDARTRSEGAANRGVTMRGQDLADARGRDTAERGDWQYDPDRGMQVNKRTGEARPVTQDGRPIGPKDKDAPEALLKAAGYADRMKKASVIFESTPSGQTPGYIETLAPSGRAGTLTANVSRDPQRQKYYQAAEDWVRAKLRQESGAVIADEEMAREIRTYFPQIGDSPEVIAQKTAARKTAEQAMTTAAGRAARPGSGASGGWSITPVQ